MKAPNSFTREDVVEINCQGVCKGSGITAIKNLGTITTFGTNTWGNGNSGHWGAFERCNNLVYAIIPSTVTNMCPYTFQNCTALEYVVINATTPPTYNNAFNGCLKLTSIYVPDESVEDYKDASGWSALANSIKPISDLPTE